MTDIRVLDHGSIFVLAGVSPEGTAWLEENLDPQAQRWGHTGFVVEPRYVEAITDGAAADGLELTL